MNFDNVLNAPAFVIHLEEISPDRRHFFEENIKNAGFNDMRIFKGVNARNKKQLKTILSKYKNIKFDKNLKIGAIGCMLSHFELYLHIIENNIDLCTIFEDDVFFHPKWNELAPLFFEQTPKDFDVLFVGNKTKVISGLSEINKMPCLCTHAYVITLNGAKKMLNSLLRWNFNNKVKLSLGGISARGSNELKTIDAMIYDLQIKMITKKIPPIFKWYCWNGTNYKCAYNYDFSKLIYQRNTGLAFQSENFNSTIDETFI